MKLINIPSQYLSESQLARKRGLEVVEVIEIGKRIALTDENLEKYGWQLTQVIKQTQPTLIAIEKKETSGLTTPWTNAEYLKLLEIGKKVAKDLGVKLTNGGIDGDELIVFYAKFLKLSNREKYQNFIAKLDKNRKLFLTDIKYAIKVKEIEEKLQAFLKTYKKVRINFLNVNWNYANPEVLNEVLSFIKNLTGMEIISTEFIKPYDKDISKKLLETVNRLKLKCVVYYFGIEGLMGEELVNKLGKFTKKAKQLKSFIWWHYNKKPRVISIFTEKAENDENG